LLSPCPTELAAGTGRPHRRHNQGGKVLRSSPPPRSGLIRARRGRDGRVPHEAQGARDEPAGWPCGPGTGIGAGRRRGAGTARGCRVGGAVGRGRARPHRRSRRRDYRLHGRALHRPCVGHQATSIGSPEAVGQSLDAGGATATTTGFVESSGPRTANGRAGRRARRGPGKTRAIRRCPGRHAAGPVAGLRPALSRLTAPRVGRPAPAPAPVPPSRWRGAWRGRA
jgi:hypothetical protein